MLFRKKIERSCTYCTHCARPDDGQLLCTKKGIRQDDQKCRKFKYDPFKRIPPKAKALDFSKYDANDYSL